VDVTSGSARHGRRNNGLFAAEYAVVGDVDPRIGEHLLDVLGNRGIAAYLQPSSDQHPITRLTTLPGRPIDRLYVDRRELSTAREFFAIATADTAGPIDPDGISDPTAPARRTSGEFDAAWASIVASFDKDPTGDPVWPSSEDDPRPAGAATATPERSDPNRRPVRADTSGTDQRSLLDGLDSFGTDTPDDEDEDYQPPAPPPLPRLTGGTLAAVLGVIIGIAVIIFPGLLPVSTTAAAVLGGACLVAGGVALIARLRPGDDDDDDDPDNGAVV
jgi:hypothetical protein